MAYLVVATVPVGKVLRTPMNVNWLRHATILALLYLLVGCSTTSPVGTSPQVPTRAAPESGATATMPAPAAATVTQPAPTEPLAQGVESMTAASNHFGFNLLQELHTAAPTENIFISPLSLSLLLQMAYNGADGESAQEIAQVLQVDGMDLAAMNEASKALQDELAATPDVELLLGNSIWIQQGFALLDTFLDTVATYFNAEAATLDFGSPQAAERINSWVSEATQGKIEELFVSLDPNVVTYLINTVYFKGEWSKPFDPKLTQPMPFRLVNGSEITVPMMTQDGDFAFTSTESYSALALPYGDGNVRMVIVLPNEGVELESILAQLTPEGWVSLSEQLESETRVIVTLPRFKMEYDATLNEALMALGMEGAFSRPDFANMVEGGGMWISYVRHKAIVEVNEEGTEAAAVSVGAMELSMPPTFTVNRPFFFAIQDGTTATLLFMGAVYEPELLAE
jgi:serpin B